MLSMLIRVLLVDGIVLRVILPCKYVHPEIVREGRGIESKMEPPRGGGERGIGNYVHWPPFCSLHVSL